MTTAPSFPFYVNNWLASARVMEMTCEQEGAYVHLLAHAWNQPDCGLPREDKKLAALSRLGERWETCKTEILNCFYEKDGRIFNERLLLCFQDRLRWIEKSRNGGMTTARKWRELKDNGGTTTLTTVAQPPLQPQPQPFAYTDSQTQTQTPDQTQTPIQTDRSVRQTDRQTGPASPVRPPSPMQAEFLTVWAEYPDKSGKQEAFNAYKKARAAGATQQEILDGLRRYLKYIADKRAHGFYELNYKNGSTWFNRSGWKDEYVIETPKRKECKYE